MNEVSPLQIVPADLDRPEHAQAILDLLDEYAREPIIDGGGLPEAVRGRLIEELKTFDAAHIFLAFREETAIGVAVCFLGFSTFYARPLLNIHDFAVRAEQRGRGVGTALLAAIEQRAKELNCCKMTLEVRSDNLRAQGLYRRVGFTSGPHDSAQFSFWSKPLGE